MWLLQGNGLKAFKYNRHYIDNGHGGTKKVNYITHLGRIYVLKYYSWLIGRRVGIFCDIHVEILSSRET